MRVVPTLRMTAASARAGERVHAPAMRLIVSVGWPIGAVVLLDSLTLLVSQLLVGRFWLEAVPVHAVVVLWTSMGLVIPLGIAQAAVQHVAVHHSRNDWRARNRVAVASLALGGLYGAVALGLFAGAPVSLGAVLLGAPAFEQASQALLRQIMPLGGVVLALQGLVIIAAAILRGVGQTRGPLFQALVGYLGVAAGGQAVCAFGLKLGVVGVWWGLTAGFAFIAVAVVHAVYTTFRKPSSTRA
jgi:MATE family multidrug resistance protein